MCVLRHMPVESEECDDGLLAECAAQHGLASVLLLLILHVICFNVRIERVTGSSGEGAHAEDQDLTCEAQSW